MTEKIAQPPLPMDLAFASLIHAHSPHAMRDTINIQDNVKKTANPTAALTEIHVPSLTAPPHVQTAHAPSNRVTMTITKTAMHVSKTPSALVVPPQNNATSPTPSIHVQIKHVLSPVSTAITKITKINV